ncbi:MAG: M57 family metalloprotease [Longimicrobiaceae bacterium]
MQRIRVLRGIAVLALAALGACDTTRSTSVLEPMDQVDDLARQVEAMGFRSEEMQDFGEYVLVEGDIMIPRTQLRSGPSRRTNDPMGPRFQYRTSNLVGSPKVQQITVDLSGLASQPAWQSAAATALTHWNGIAGSYVRMVQGSPADITAGTTCTSSNTAAFANVPSAGNPGSNLYVNTCFGSSTTDAQKLHNMVHEFGHTLGFHHSNYAQLGESGAYHIYGTPTSGNATGSVMNGATALNSWAGFSAADALATRTLYPLPTPTGLAVSHPSGTVVLSWNPVVGAASYLIRRVEERTVNDWISNNFQTTVTETWSGSVSGTSYNTGNAWTGTSSCMWTYTWSYDDSSTYSYLVVAEFPNGTSAYAASVLSEDAVC